MGYTKTDWLKRISQFPDRYTLVDLGGGLFTITPSEGNVTQEGTPLSEAALNNLETQYDKANADFTAHKTNATPPGVHRWTAGRLLEGAGAGADPTEIAVPVVSTTTFIISDALRNYNDAEKTTTSSTYVKLKETKLNANLSACRVKFDLKSSAAGVYVYAKIYKNGTAIGTDIERSTDTYATYSQDFYSFVANDLIQIYAHQAYDTATAYVQNFRLCYTKNITAIAGDTLETALTTTTAISTTNQDPA